MENKNNANNNHSSKQLNKAQVFLLEIYNKIYNKNICKEEE